MKDTGDLLQRSGQSPARDAADQTGSGPRLVADNAGLVARSLGKQYKKRPLFRVF